MPSLSAPVALSFFTVILAWAPAAIAQTQQQSETSLHFLQQLACASDTSGRWEYTGTVDAPAPVDCIDDSLCAAVGGRCEHRSLVEADPAVLYAPLEHPAAPSAGVAVAKLRYVPLCENGSGDHEWSLGLSAAGAPTCAAEDYIRCGDGTRPLYYVDGAQGSEDWLIHAGGGGHDSSVSYNPDNPKAQARLRE